MKERELSASEVQEWKRTDAQIAAATPKAQAEAMAKEIFRDSLRIFDAKNIAEDEAIREAISTALEKLLAENERLKNEAGMTQERSAEKTSMNPNEFYPNFGKAKCGQCDNLQSQLTATETRMETAKTWLEHSPSCPKFNQSENFIVRPVKQCTCGLDAFLSALTAEKKEQHMNSKTISVDELQCVCGNVQSITIKIPSNIRIAVCSQCLNEWPIGAVIETAEKKEEAK